jgi:hypothetical protein
MRARMLLAGTVGVAAMALWLSAAVAGDVRIGVNIGVPAPPLPVVVAPAPPVVVAPSGPQVVAAPPPLVFAAPPALVVVPGSPSITSRVRTSISLCSVVGTTASTKVHGSWRRTTRALGPWFPRNGCRTQSSPCRMPTTRFLLGTPKK